MISSKSFQNFHDHVVDQQIRPPRKVFGRNQPEFLELTIKTRNRFPINYGTTAPNQAGLYDLYLVLGTF